MEEKNYTGIIPNQQTGKRIDVESFVEMNNVEEAKAFFTIVKSRLQNVNGWHHLAGSLSAHFQVVDSEGTEVNRPVQKDDYFKIDIPGPGTKSGDGYDWVQVEEMETSETTDVESFGLRVRPAKDPQNKKEDVAHFYSPDSTSSFTVTREGAKITVAIYDRNTKPNTEANTIVDKVRDAVVGAAGVLSFSKLQWKSLADGLLKKE